MNLEKTYEAFKEYKKIEDEASKKWYAAGATRAAYKEFLKAIAPAKKKYQEATRC